MAEYVIHPEALSGPELESLREALLGSRFVARSTLVGMFRHSRGFAFIFTRAGQATLEERFPFLRGYLARVMDPEGVKGLRPGWQRLWGAVRGRRPNAFYLNLLLLEQGQGVGRHRDVTLRKPSEEAQALPEHVSVLYLQVPEGARGGALRLWRGDQPVGEVQPRPGLLLHFRGDLWHEVDPFTGGGEGALRASLVCEQYVLGPAALERLPAFSLQSKAGFAAYLEEHQARGS